MAAKTGAKGSKHDGQCCPRTANLLCTSLDSRDQLCEKYPRAEDRLHTLAELGVVVMHRAGSTNAELTRVLIPTQA